MAIISGIIQNSSLGLGTIGVTFVPQETPQELDGNVVIGQKERIVTGSAGTFELELAEGRYIAQLDNGEEFTFDVPSGTDAYDISTLITSEADSEADLSGEGSPEGIQTAAPGTTYYDTLNDDDWRKDSGDGNTGWRRLA